MTSGEPPAPPSLARFGGFALIGIGVLAAGFGVVAVMTGGAHNAMDTTHPPATSAVPSSSSPSSPVAVPPAVPGVPGSAAASPSGPAGPGTGANQAGSPGIGDQAPQIVVRLYNNSMIQGLASRAADDFRRDGYDVAEVGNYAAGIIPTTTIYYEPGTPEQAEAEQVAVSFGARALPRFPGIESASPGLIAIITDDYRGPQGGK
jgi:hypothetical protein